MKLDGCTEFARAETELVAFGAGPRTPLDDDGEAGLKQAAAEGPLQGFDRGAAGFVVQIDVEGVHPIVRGEADGVRLRFERGGEGGLTGAG